MYLKKLKNINVTYFIIYYLKNMKLRQHQINCIEKIDEHFKNENKALVKMFCGSGKSLIIYNSLLKYCKNLSVVVPSINLITQFNRDYLLNNNEQFKLLTICSKNELINSETQNCIILFTFV